MTLTRASRLLRHSDATGSLNHRWPESSLLSSCYVAPLFTRLEAPATFLRPEGLIYLILTPSFGPSMTISCLILCQGPPFIDTSTALSSRYFTLSFVIFPGKVKATEAELVRSSQGDYVSRCQYRTVARWRTENHQARLV